MMIIMMMTMIMVTMIFTRVQASAFGTSHKMRWVLLLKVNSALKPIFSVIEDQCSGGQ